MTVRRRRLISIGFLGVLVGLGAAGYLVARAAQTAILESQSGSISEYSLDPTAPGFRAFTESTRTALVLHTAVVPGVGADLVGVTLLTEADGEAGGTVLTVPAAFAVASGADRPLDELFRSDGLDAVTQELSLVFRMGFGDVVVLDASSWTLLMRADLPLTLTLREDLIELTQDGTETTVLVPAGTRPFDLIEVARIASHRNPGESTSALARRQQAIWQSWISRTAGEAERPPLFETSGFVEIINSLANAEVSFRVAPTTTTDRETSTGEASEVLLGDEQALVELMPQLVPFPESSVLGDRPSVLLLDSTRGEVPTDPVVTAITQAGGRVTILGNSDVGAVRETEVQLHDSSPEAAATANEIAALLGAPPVRQVPLTDATAAISVVVG